jgi:hypothetical protein
LSFDRMILDSSNFSRISYLNGSQPIRISFYLKIPFSSFFILFLFFIFYFYFLKKLLKLSPYLVKIRFYSVSGAFSTLEYDINLISRMKIQ